MRKILSLLLFIILFFSFESSFAQPGGGGPGGGGDPDIPIGGIEFLLLAGAALGIKKLIKTKKN